MDYSAAPISAYAEGIHQQVLGKIRNLVGDPSISRRVFEADLVDFEGCVTDPFEDGLTHVLVDKRIAGFMKGGCAQRSLARANPHRTISPEDVFMSVTAHEYGHILFDGRIERRMYQVMKQAPFFSVPMEFREAFAFCFEDMVTGVRVPIDEMRGFYEREGLDSDEMASFYLTLRTMGGRNKNLVLSPDSLARVISKPRN